MTYPEVLKLRTEYLIWHYLNIVEAEEEKRKADYEFKKYLMALIQPEWYKKQEEKEKSEVYETKVDLNSKDLTAEDLRKIAENARQINENAYSTVIQSPIEPPIPEEWQNPISLTEE